MKCFDVKRQGVVILKTTNSRFVVNRLHVTGHFSSHRHVRPVFCHYKTAERPLCFGLCLIIDLRQRVFYRQQRRLEYHLFKFVVSISSDTVISLYPSGATMYMTRLRLISGNCNQKRDCQIFWFHFHAKNQHRHTSKAF